MKEFLKTCLSLSDWESALSSIVSASKKSNTTLGADASSLNLLIACLVKAQGYSKTLQLEEFIRKSAQKKKKVESEKSSQVTAPKTAKTSSWPKTPPKLSVPTSRFAKLFGKDLETGKPLEKKVTEIPCTKEPSRVNCTESMMFFPNSSDLKELIRMLIDNQHKQRALELLERHLLLCCLRQKYPSPPVPSFYGAAVTDPQDIDESIFSLIQEFSKYGEFDRLFPLVICSGYLPLSSSLVISVLEGKEMRTEVRSLLEGMNRQTRAALTSTYSALIATWASKRR